MLFLCLTFFCYSQNEKELYKKDVPILLYPDFQSEKLTIEDSAITDSLKVFFQVVVDFKYPLKDTTKCIIVDDVNILTMRVTSLNTKKHVINFSYNNEKGTPYQKYIWDLCNKQFGYWYRNQPYNMLKNKFEWGKRAVFGGVLYIKNTEQ
jgi:hypothetical protein